DRVLAAGRRDVVRLFSALLLLEQPSDASSHRVGSTCDGAADALDGGEHLRLIRNSVAIDVHAPKHPRDGTGCRGYAGAHRDGARRDAATDGAGGVGDP